jgi:EmrB/QacA subfamily drug resistance transporter
MQHPNKWLVFFLVSAGVFFSTMDSSMVNISLPYIMKDFGTSLGQTEWVVLMYLLTTSVTMLFWGHLANRFKRENLYTAGLFIFGTGSFLCSRATNLDFLVTCRFFQALGAAMLMANGPAMIKSAFGAKKLGRSLGLIGIATSLGLMAGPAVGGFVIEYRSWQTLFLLPVPICFLAALLALKKLPHTIPDHTNQPFDWTGGFWWLILLTSTTYFLSHATGEITRPILTTGGFLLSFTALLLFIKRESALSSDPSPTSPAPLIPTGLFQKRSVFIGTATIAMVFLCLFSVLILTPFYLNMVLHVSSSKIGLVMLAIPITALITAPVAGWLADKTDAKLIATCGLVVCTAGLFFFTTLSTDTTPLTVALRLGCFGVGLSLFLSPNSTMVLRQTADKHTSTVAALLATGRTLGMLMGISLAGLTFSLFFSHFTGGLDMKDYTDTQATAFIESLRLSYYCFLGIGIGAIILATFAPAEKQIESPSI